VVENWNKFHNEVTEQEWEKKYDCKLWAEIVIVNPSFLQYTLPVLYNCH
jgi:hypothetical protein